MSRRRDCYENAVEKVVREYIDGFYEPDGHHSSIGGMSPIAFEQWFRARGEQEKTGLRPRTPETNLTGWDQERLKTAA